MSGENVVSNSNSLLLWDKDWFKAQRLYMIRKSARKVKAQKELYEIVSKNKIEIDNLCKIFGI